MDPLPGTNLDPFACNIAIVCTPFRMAALELGVWEGQAVQRPATEALLGTTIYLSLSTTSTKVARKIEAVIQRGRPNSGANGDYGFSLCECLKCVFSRFASS